ncbi:MAG: hypothetical protein CMP85_08250 [Gammaproteobacteria bacterium]|nr:hypothetical protein [Gammaproteobacteria bacterium]
MPLETANVTVRHHFADAQRHRAHPVHERFLDALVLKVTHDLAGQFGQFERDLTPCVEQMLRRDAQSRLRTFGHGYVRCGGRQDGIGPLFDGKRDHDVDNTYMLYTRNFNSNELKSTNTIASGTI